LKIVPPEDPMHRTPTAIIAILFLLLALGTGCSEDDPVAPGADSTI
jgi:hypothetical protein